MVSLWAKRCTFWKKEKGSKVLSCLSHRDKRIKNTLHKCHHPLNKQDFRMQKQQRRQPTRSLSHKRLKNSFAWDNCASPTSIEFRPGPWFFWSLSDLIPLIIYGLLNVLENIQALRAQGPGGGCAVFARSPSRQTSMQKQPQAPGKPVPHTQSSALLIPLPGLTLHSAAALLGDYCYWGKRSTNLLFSSPEVPGFSRENQRERVMLNSIHLF